MVGLGVEGASKKVKTKRVMADIEDLLHYILEKSGYIYLSSCYKIDHT